MSTPKNTLRNIVIFSTPLGPQGTASSSGSESLYPGNWLLSPTWAQHWGLLIQDETDSSGAMDTFFELYRPENTIDVLRRSRAEREASETANPSSVSYQNTAFKTDWTDDEIEQCGKRLFSFLPQRKFKICILSDKRRQESLQPTDERHICLDTSKLPDVGESSSQPHRLWHSSDCAFSDHIAPPLRRFEPNEFICSQRVRSCKFGNLKSHTTARIKRPDERYFRWCICGN